MNDVSSLSHEVAEWQDDPFGNNPTKPWGHIGQVAGCQNNLEVGDVIEGLPDSTFPMTMPNGFTYHPQNEALLSYFARQTHSTAIHGAYSYPNENTLRSISPPERAFCQ